MPRAGTLRQVVDYAKASGADEVVFDIGRTTTSEAEILDVAGRILPMMRAG